MVKKVFSILFSLLLLISVMHIRLATHFCGGVKAATLVSFTGELATCGMESCLEHPFTGNAITSHCCDNEVIAFKVDENYSPSYQEFKAFALTVLQIFAIPADFTSCSFSALKHINVSESPPGGFLASLISLPFICVFRN
jgi:hypothetical protein